jgi:hypothetical protein
VNKGVGDNGDSADEPPGKRMREVAGLAGERTVAADLDHRTLEAHQVLSSAGGMDELGGEP